MKKTNKAGVLVSAVAVTAVCASVIAGSTFALFTADDKVDVTVKAGNVGVTATIENEVVNSPASIDYATGAVAEDTAYAKSTEASASYANKLLTVDKLLAGDRVEYDIVVSNTGDVAAKYNYEIDCYNGFSLMRKFNISMTRTAETTTTGKMVLDEADKTNLKKFTSDWEEIGAGKTVTYHVTMELPSTAGNEYKGLTTNISVLAHAVQANANVGNSYNAEHFTEVSTPEALAAALANGGAIALADDIALVAVDTGNPALNPLIDVSNDTYLDLSGKTISVDPESVQTELECTPALINVINGATLTVDGNGTIDTEANGSGVYGINVTNGNLIVNGGKHYGGVSAVQLVQGKVVINDGYFDMCTTAKSAAPESYTKYIINVIDRYYTDGSAVVEMKGGTIVGFNPSANPEGVGTSYVAEGYTVVETGEVDGRIMYSVVKAD